MHAWIAPTQAGYCGVVVVGVMCVCAVHFLSVCKLIHVDSRNYCLDTYVRGRDYDGDK